MLWAGAHRGNTAIRHGGVMLPVPRERTDSTAGRPTLEFDRAQRSSQCEILDGSVVSTELGRILRDLARFNGAILGHWPVLQWLDRANRKLPADQMLTLVDVGCGYGDLLRAVRRWARRRRRHIRLVGIDMKPQVVEIARGATDAAYQIEYEGASPAVCCRARPAPGSRRDGP